jgi:hypothetical protein
MTFAKRISSHLTSLSAALVVAVLGFALSFAAKPALTTPAQEQIKVAGHLELPGIRVRHMLLQQRGDKYYLFLRRVDKNDFAIVDVTDPTKPVLVDRNSLKEAPGGEVEMPAPGSALAIAFVPDSSSGTAASASAAKLGTETIHLIDLSDPKRPKTIRTFKGVTSVATDDGRKLVFLVNDEGLWVVSHHRNRPLPLCTSEAEISSMPECR